MTKINHKQILEKDLVINLQASRQKEMLIPMERLAEIVVEGLGEDSLYLGECIKVAMLKNVQAILGKKNAMGFSKE